LLVSIRIIRDLSVNQDHKNTKRNKTTGDKAKKQGSAGSVNTVGKRNPYQDKCNPAGCRYGMENKMNAIIHLKIKIFCKNCQLSDFTTKKPDYL